MAQFVGEAMGERQTEAPGIHVGKGGSNHGKRLSWIVVNTDDMPFLVDSVAAAISARGRTIERLLHPVIDAGRTASGRLVSVKRHDPGAKIAGQRESLIFIEMERSEEHTSELQSLMRISYAVFCLKKKKTQNLNQQSYRH